MLNRWIERDGLTDTLDELGVGSIAFTQLAQGLLSKKYLGGIPEISRATQNSFLDAGVITDEMIAALQGLNAISEARGQTLAQMALA